jgi:hypothetical protein
MLLPPRAFRHGRCLADAGFVVVAMNHTGDNYADRPFQIAPFPDRFAEAAFGYASRQNAASGAKGRTDHVHRHRALRNVGLTLFIPLRR